MEHNSIIISIFLGVIGLAMGSFAGAMVWRLRARQLREDAAAGEKVHGSEKKEVRRIKHTSLTNDRSVCLHCGHSLAWYDLLPVVSWATLKGKCRYCHERIGFTELLLEIGMAAFFVLSFLAWPVDLNGSIVVTQFVLWLVFGVGLGILSVYDAKWFLLPNQVVFPLIGIGVINALLVLTQDKFAADSVVSIIDACLVLSGLYYVIYVASKHQWVGLGDVKLGLALALMLADWRLSLLALFLANAIGTIVILPLLIAKKITRTSHVPFGPFLIAGWIVAGLFGYRIIEWYSSLILGA